VHRIFYRLIASVALLAVRSGHSKDLEMIVVRHQLAAFERQFDWPAINDDDRSTPGRSPRHSPGHANPRSHIRSSSAQLSG
jgi:hypothetical protein